VAHRDAIEKRIGGSASLTALEATDRRAPVITDPIAINERLTKLPDVTVLGLEEVSGLTKLHVERKHSFTGCPRCGVVAHVKDRTRVEYVDLPVYGEPTRLAQASASLPGQRLPDGELDRRGPSHRAATDAHDGPGRPLGHPPGRTLCAQRLRGGEGAGV
jgi:hypothetical protein